MCSINLHLSQAHYYHHHLVKHAVGWIRVDVQLHRHITVSTVEDPIGETGNEKLKSNVCMGRERRKLVRMWSKGKLFVCQILSSFQFTMLSHSNRIRQVELVIEPGQSLGLMIRGGIEYGLGIYVTGVDKDSVADRAGLMVSKENVFVEYMCAS
jgi:hypothetical protein